MRVNLNDFKLVAGRKLSTEFVAKKANVVMQPLLNITAHGDRSPPGPHVTLSQAAVLDMPMSAQSSGGLRGTTCPSTTATTSL